MIEINLSKYKYKGKSENEIKYIFCNNRKKYIKLTPEEYVRQGFLQYLEIDKKYPMSLIAVEKQITIYNVNKRFDIVVFDKQGLPFIVIECKALNVNLSQDTIDQISRYNIDLRAKYMVITNGSVYYAFKQNELKNNFEIIDEIPAYQ